MRIQREIPPLSLPFLPGLHVDWVSSWYIGSWPNVTSNELKWYLSVLLITLQMIDFNTQMMIELLQLIYNPTTTDLVLVFRGETGQAVEWLGLTVCLIWEMVCIVLVSISWIVGWGLCGFQAGCEKKRDCQIVTSWSVYFSYSFNPIYFYCSSKVQSHHHKDWNCQPDYLPLSPRLESWSAITLCWSARASAECGWWL